ncbi:MAG: hypothetical protein COB41_06815 [Proteobacteria bacterium]|nr:MAG: hypothetical protein COB41_06815 [Pseudomonadota bacterium]
MQARRTCKQLETDANRIAEGIIEKFKIIEKDYDSHTNHGMNDGAIFP